ncbi:MAG TPA: hypothetical protein VJS43_00160 [Candidatus Acidoferrales bacterium]|nr:hypothetical protein [Candidatus Acidoferrales bacterium]
MPVRRGTGGSAEIDQLSLSPTQKDLIQEQLARILASPLFSHSKRFPEFLRYTVNRALQEDTESIKERTIGVEVFGREANYDTSLDPVVRMTAVEVRKRLAQYYQLPIHEHEPRIEFERGSYVPEFRIPEEAAETLAQAANAEATKGPAYRRRGTWIFAACVGVPVLAMTGLLLGGAKRSPLDVFWSPVTASKSPVLICMPDLDTILGSMNESQPSPASDLLQEVSHLPVPFRRDKVSFGDSMAVASVAGLLGSQRKEFWVRHTEDMKLDDLREGPVVLVGAFSNQWALQLGNALRYSFAREGDTFYIRDAVSPSSRQWVETENDGKPPSVDYALISRVLDPTTGSIVITAAGIRQYGTQSAGECITDANCFEQAEKVAPGDWANANIQIVLETTVIGENPGKAKVVAARVW